MPRETLALTARVPASAAAGRTLRTTAAGWSATAP